MINRVMFVMILTLFLRKWWNDYESLVIFYSTPCTFDDDLFTACTNELPLLERVRVVRDILDDELSASKNDEGLELCKNRPQIGGQVYLTKPTEVCVAYMYSAQILICFIGYTFPMCLKYPLSKAFDVYYHNT